MQKGRRRVVRHGPTIRRAVSAVRSPTARLLFFARLTLELPEYGRSTATLHRIMTDQKNGRGGEQVRIIGIDEHLGHLYCLSPVQYV